MSGDRQASNKATTRRQTLASPSDVTAAALHTAPKLLADHKYSNHKAHCEERSKSQVQTQRMQEQIVATSGLAP
eukprot:155200-Amphidinium_carterae.1